MLSCRSKDLQIDRSQRDLDKLERLAPVLFQQPDRRVISQVSDLAPDAVRLNLEPVTYFLKKIQE